jgi:hypothetical protein
MDVRGSGVVCLEGLDRRALEGLRKIINKRSHDRRCPDRDSNRGLPNTEHECCRLRGVVTRENTFLLFITSKPQISTPHNLMLNIYKSSLAIKRNLQTLCTCSNGTRYSHSTYSLLLRTADVNTGFMLFVMQRSNDWCIWKMHPQLRMHKEPSGCRFRDAYRDLFETLKILRLQSQMHIFLLLCVANNRSKFKMNSGVYNINTKEKFYYHQHSSNVSPYKNSIRLA